MSVGDGIPTEQSRMVSQHVDAVVPRDPKTLRPATRQHRQPLNRRTITPRGPTPQLSIWQDPPEVARTYLDYARNSLRRRAPDLSAASPAALWQRSACFIAPPLMVGALFLNPGMTVAVGLAFVSAIFLLVIVLRWTALWMLVARVVPARVRPVADADLPTYAVLVPMFREGAIARDTIASLARLDYPSDRVEILLVCEADDVETLGAIVAVPLPPQFRLVLVPPSEPRTKPKALNYALATTQAELIVIYDAEDMPNPSQLRQAAAIFAQRGARLACLQARLNVYNRQENWLTRQFTIEYTALFDGLLPALRRLGLPLPLGGTSNHFRRAVLLRVGAWDPFNVTEDADLGIRLDRFGYDIDVLRATTFEEAPAEHRAWIKQRTRWMLGWMQTVIVHTRRPGRLVRELGPWRSIGLLLLAVGLIATVLLHPVVYLSLLFQLGHEAPFGSGGSTFEIAIWTLAGLNFILGVGSAIGVAAAGLAGRGYWRLFLSLPLMPLYWLLTSYAGWRALLQLAMRRRKKPIMWEKTPHRSRRSSDAI
ncbi:MAG: glycosyltransferase [Pseudomonadota bacterium]